MPRVLFVVCATAVSAAHASGSLSLSPAVVQLRGEPGESTTQALTLTNSTHLDLEFQMEAKDVVVRDGKRVFLAAGSIPASIAATALFSSTSIVIPAGQKRSATVMVTLPPNASNRAVIVLFRGTTKIGEGKSGATASLGTLLTFALSERVSVRASELTVTPQSPTTNTALGASLANDGSEPVLARGIAVVLDSNGAIVGKAAFEPRRLLPGERTALRTEYPGVLRAGSYRVLSTFEYEGKSFTRSADLVVR
jgi:hypothetical protein